jgi:hypothetical protein
MLSALPGKLEMPGTGARLLGLQGLTFMFCSSERCHWQRGRCVEALKSRELSENKNSLPLPRR